MTHATHDMSLQTWSFDKICTGEKTLELRLYDEKRKVIQLGDTIVFSDANHSDRTVQTEVIGLMLYPTFDALIDDVPLFWLARGDRDEAKAGVYQFYDRDKEAELGVIGIRIRRV